MTKIEGHVLEENLPIKKGDRIIVKKGTKIKRVHYGETVAKKTYKVTVDSVTCGKNAEGDTPACNPTVRWTGLGSYICEADINDVEKVTSDAKVTQDVAAPAQQ